MRRRIWRIRQNVWRTLYRDPNPDLGRSRLVMGAGRSGTTWVAELLGSAGPSRIIFEPFNHGKVGEPARDYELHYARPGEPDPVLRAFLEKVFTGRLRGPWVDRYADSLRPCYRVVKAIRANLMAGWIAQQFPEVPIVMVVRHPCAVVLSRMERGWDPDKEIRLLQKQPLLRQDHGELYERAASLKTVEEKHAAIWAACYRVPLLQPRAENMHVFHYEQLVDRPAVELPALFRAAGLEVDHRVLLRARRPSQTSQRSLGPMEPAEMSRRWMRTLAPDQVRRILDVARTLGPEEGPWLE